MKRKVINIEENVYAALKEYCAQYGYKISKFVERIIIKEIDYVDTSMSKMQKK